MSVGGGVGGGTSEKHQKNIHFIETLFDNQTTSPLESKVVDISANCSQSHTIMQTYPGFF